MNRKNLTAAVLAGLAGVAGIAGTAQAVNLNPDGVGQVLLYPYYTTNDGNQTLISVVNTTENAKAVKVRFLEGFNSREVLDFNLYLSREDVWTAALYQGEACAGFECVTTMVTADTSCTVPYIYGMGGMQEFLPYAFTGDFADGGPDGMSRAAEGHIEMIEMGTLVGDAAADVTHTDGVPADCMALTDRWTRVVGGDNGEWYDESQEDCDADTGFGEEECGQAYTDTTRNSGGLFGAASVINVGNGTMYSYDAKAIQGFDSEDDGIHYIPGTIYPSLASGSETTAWVFFGVPQNQAVDVIYSNSVDAISGVFMHDNLMNEYSTDPELNAGTEWVITFPTKNFYVDDERMQREGLIADIDDAEDGGDQDGLSCKEIEDDGVGTGKYDCVAEVRAPFTQLFGAMDSDDNPLCEIVGLKTWDREENTYLQPDQPDVIIPPVVSPAPPEQCIPGYDEECTSETVFQLCHEVNVLRFGEESVFGTPDLDGQSLLLSVEDEFTEGWGRISFTFTGAFEDDEPVARTDEEGLVGLPVTGFAAMQFENGYLDGGSVKANYGGLFQHKFSVRSVENDGAEVEPRL